MAKKRVAVVAVHGMGSFGPEQPASVAKPSYSERLHAKIREKIGSKVFDDNVAWGEVFYANVLQVNQTEYLKRIAPKVSTGQIREFVVNNLGDPASYSANPTDPKNMIYGAVRKCIETTFKRLQGLVTDDAPMIVLAHSLGGHVISNHIWDSQSPNSAMNAGVPFSMTGRIAALVTFGCNIPIFTFAYKSDDVQAISRPSNDLSSSRRLTPWWQNFYDSDDVLGYPLAETGKGYTDLAKKGELQDNPINAGGLFTSWNAFSHTAYWADDDLAQPVAKMIEGLFP